MFFSLQPSCLACNYVFQLATMLSTACNYIFQLSAMFSSLPSCLLACNHVFQSATILSCLQLCIPTCYYVVNSLLATMFISLQPFFQLLIMLSILQPCFIAYNHFFQLSSIYLALSHLSQLLNFNHPSAIQTLVHFNQGNNARKVISEVYASFVLQCTVSGR